MAKMSITVRGKRNEWAFEFDGHPKHLAEWREDGLNVVKVHEQLYLGFPASDIIAGLLACIAIVVISVVLRSL